jgi:hypothetical protein
MVCGALLFKLPNTMEPEDLYLTNCRESAEMAYEWASQAKRHARSIDALPICLFSFAANFLTTLFLIIITR